MRAAWRTFGRRQKRDHGPFTCEKYATRTLEDMESSIADQTEAAAIRARSRLSATRISTGRPAERDAATIAQAALFEEALLNAVRARLAELKAAAR
jgi:hypothetical protein